MSPRRDACGRYLSGESGRPKRRPNRELERAEPLAIGDVQPWALHRTQLLVIGQALRESPGRGKSAKRVRGTDYLDMLDALGVPARRIELSDEDRSELARHRPPRRRGRAA